MNTFGTLYRLTSFGESHGPAIGGVIDGIPSRIVINLNEIQAELDRRRPGTSALTTQRNEADKLTILSGLMAWDSATGEASALTPDTATAITLGTPIGFMVANTDARSRDYAELRHTYRPSHADYAYDCRYGIRDWRGGGRSSGRETICRVVAGAFARQILTAKGIAIATEVLAVGDVKNPTAQQFEETVNAARAACDSVGGIVGCTITGLPAGIGTPAFGKLEQMLGAAMLSIGGVKGVDFGMGFEGVSRRGSEVADTMRCTPGGNIAFNANNSGGIQGGISNGAPVTMRIAVKPTASIAQPLDTVTDSGRNATLTVKGRHDPCLITRIRPVIEAMAAITLLDALLLTSRL